MSGDWKALITQGDDYGGELVPGGESESGDYGVFLGPSRAQRDGFMRSMRTRPGHCRGKTGTCAVLGCADSASCAGSTFSFLSFTVTHCYILTSAFFHSLGTSNFKFTFMGRWSQYDEVRTLSFFGLSRYNYQNQQDDYRLPEGFKRVGYDADSGKYFFRDKEGQLWEGQEGEHFGEMTRGTPALSTLCDEFQLRAAVSVAPATPQGDGDDVENGPQGEEGYALLTGDDVSAFPRISESWAANRHLG